MPDKNTERPFEEEEKTDVHEAEDVVADEAEKESGMISYDGAPREAEPPGEPATQCEEAVVNNTSAGARPTEVQNGKVLGCLQIFLERGRAVEETDRDLALRLYNQGLQMATKNGLQDDPMALALEHFKILIEAYKLYSEDKVENAVWKLDEGLILNRDNIFLQMDILKKRAMCVEKMCNQIKGVEGWLFSLCKREHLEFLAALHDQVMELHSSADDQSHRVMEESSQALVLAQALWDKGCTDLRGTILNLCTVKGLHCLRWTALIWVAPVFLQNAIGAMETALKLKPEIGSDPEVYQMIIQVKEANGKNREAKQLFQEYEMAYPKCGWAEQMRGTFTGMLDLVEHDSEDVGTDDSCSVVSTDSEMSNGAAGWDEEWLIGSNAQTPTKELKHKDHSRPTSKDRKMTKGGKKKKVPTATLR